MGTLIGTISRAILQTPALTSLIGAVAEDGARRFSKTKLGAHIALGGAFWAILPELIGPALGGDPAAIGKIVLLAGGWLMSLWGRGNKG